MIKTPWNSPGKARPENCRWGLCFVFRNSKLTMVLGHALARSGTPGMASLMGKTMGNLSNLGVSAKTHPWWLSRSECQNWLNIWKLRLVEGLAMQNATWSCFVQPLNPIFQFQETLEVQTAAIWQILDLWNFISLLVFWPDCYDKLCT